MPQPKLKEAEIFSTPLEEWTPERLALIKSTLAARITKLREARKLPAVLAVREEEAAATKKKPAKKKKKSLSEEVGLE